ncbi:DNA-3-methyladenine glycosylase, partial [Stegodyphus mimosarum]
MYYGCSNPVYNMNDHHLSRKKRTLSNRLSEKIRVSKRNQKTVQEKDCTFNCEDTDIKLNGSQSVVQLSTYHSEEIILVGSALRLTKDFYNQACTILAKDLLGKVLVRRLESGEVLRGKIVETESYLGVEDKTSHSYKGKRTERNEAMFLDPGTAYVYTIYGMYYCFNISSREEGSAVLIRALEPLDGVPTMREFRSVKRNNSSTLKDKDLCNGPSKLCQAFKIEKTLLNKADLCTSSDLWLETGFTVARSDIVACKRIGVDSYGDEWANKPLRYYIKGNLYVSIKNKVAEKLLEQSSTNG